jgi:charged multivesicular body protein 6
MLGGKISNQDEDDVEQELAAMEAELGQTAPLPNVPDTALPAHEIEADPQPARSKQKQPERQAMLAS